MHRLKVFLHICMACLHIHKIACVRVRACKSHVFVALENIYMFVCVCVWAPLFASVCVRAFVCVWVYVNVCVCVCV